MRDITITSPDYAGAGSSDPQRLLRQILDCGATSTNRSRFFRVFGCETVEIELTDIKSSTYVRLSHLNTSTQNL